jgi:hypothetical protein
MILTSHGLPVQGKKTILVNTVILIRQQIPPSDPAHKHNILLTNAVVATPHKVHPQPNKKRKGLPIAPVTTKRMALQHNLRLPKKAHPNVLQNVYNKKRAATEEPSSAKKHNRNNRTQPQHNKRRLPQDIFPPKVRRISGRTSTGTGQKRKLMSPPPPSEKRKRARKKTER